MRNVLLANVVIAAKLNNSGLVVQVMAFNKAAREITCSATTWDVTWGASESRWDEQPAHRMGMLFEIMWHLIQGHKADPQMIHDAALAIEEYRDWHYLR